MEELEKNSVDKSISLGAILRIMRKRIALLLAVFFVITAVGVVVSFVKKPYYIVSEPVAYNLKLSTEGQSHSSNPITTEATARDSYMSTVVDFCDSGIVMDRANYYYYRYKKATASERSEFIDKIYNYANDYEYIFDKNFANIPSVYKTENVSTDYAMSTTSTESNYTFNIKLKDADNNELKLKVRLLALAYADEAKSAFTGVTITIGELVETESQISSPVASFSKLTLILLFAVAGLLVALIVVYVVSALDKSVTTKEELEELTESHMIAYIYDTEVK